MNTTQPPIKWALHKPGVGFIDNYWCGQGKADFRYPEIFDTRQEARTMKDKLAQMGFCVDGYEPVKVRNAWLIVK